MQNIDSLIDTMNQLKLLGVQISLDDFGIGYSSLAYLSQFRVHTLKIDRSFIKNVAKDNDHAAIVTALIAMSHQLKIETVAEGVETMDQLAFLRNCGCHKIQGFLFSGALPADQLEQMLTEDRSLTIPE